MICECVCKDDGDSGTEQKKNIARLTDANDRLHDENYERRKDYQILKKRTDAQIDQIASLNKQVTKLTKDNISAASIVCLPEFLNT